MAIIGFLFTACSNEEHDDCIHFDYAKELVGTWTCYIDNYAEVMTFTADGKVASTGVEDGEYWEDIKGTYSVENNKLTMNFEDGDNFNDRFDLVPGQALSLVDSKTGARFTYQYCPNSYAKEIIGTWTCLTLNCTEALTFTANGQVVSTGTEDGENWEDIKGTYSVVDNRLVMTFEDEDNFDGHLVLIPGQVLILIETETGTCYTYLRNNEEEDDYIEHDYSEDILGTWSIIGADYAEAVVIKDDGTMEFTWLENGVLYEETARYKITNNRMTLTWSDGTTEEGRLDVIPECYFLMTINEETGGGYYFAYCYESPSEEIIGSWMVQSDLTSEIHTYYEDGTADCRAYYYHLGEQYETYVKGTYKVIGDILFETMDYGDDAIYSFGSRIFYTPGGSPFGDVMTSETCGYEGDEFVRYKESVVRVKPSLDLAAKKYEYADCQVNNVKGENMDIEFMGYTFNFAEMDGSGLDVMLKTLSFNMEFTDADTLSYTYQYNGGKETFHAPIATEDNKMTIKMNTKVSTLKDVTLYAFQDVDCDQLHLCMDKTAFVSFYTNMQAMMMEATDEQFDIADVDAVNAIYNNIDNAVQTIKLTIMMEK